MIRDWQRLDTVSAGKIKTLAGPRLGSTYDRCMPEVFPMYVPGRTGNGLLVDQLKKRSARLATAATKLDPSALGGGGREVAAERLRNTYALQSFTWDSPHVIDKPLSERSYSCSDPMCSRVGLPSGPHRHTSPLFHVIIPVNSGNLDLLRYRPGRGGGPMIKQEFVSHNGADIIATYPQGSPAFGTEQANGVVELLELLNEDIRQWNEALPKLIDRHLDQRLATAQVHLSDAAATGFPVRSSSTESRVYRIPDQRRSPQQSPGPPPSEVAWQLSRTDFASVLATIRTWADSVERLNGVAAGVGEDDHRNSLLTALRSRYYDGTGEAFSVQGKTDLRILVQLAHEAVSGTDQIFHAECKLWSGPSSVDDAIEQLVSKYSTARDRLGAVIFFIEDRAHPDDIEPKAIDRVISEHGGTLIDPIAGWPILRIPDPKNTSVTVELAVIVVDTQDR